MTDQDLRLERELRRSLDDRDPGPAPYALRTRVGKVPDVARTRRPSMSSSVVAIAGLAAALLLVAIGVATFGARSIDAPRVGSSPAPSASFDITASGFGVVPYQDISPVAFVVVAVALVGLVVAVLVRGRAGIVAGGTAVAVTLGLTFLALSPEPVPGSITSSGERTEWAPPRAGDDEFDLLYVTAAPDERYTYAVSLANDGPLPITVEAIADQNTHLETWPHLRAVWIDGGTDGSTVGPTRPLTGQTLRPGEQVVLWLVWDASRCAVGPGWDPANPGDAAGLVEETLIIRWSVLGWPRQDMVAMPFTAYQPVRCPD